MTRRDVGIVSSVHLKSWELEAIADALSDSEDFYRSALSRVTVVVCHSKEEWRPHGRYCRKEWTDGVVLKDGTVVVKSHSLAKISRKAWSKLLMHEVGHAYFRHTRGTSKTPGQPYWLVEAFACHVANHNEILSVTVLRNRISKNQVLRERLVANSLPFRYQSSLVHEPKDLWSYYSLWVHFVRWILSINRRASIQLQKQLHKISNKRSLDDIFTNIWGFPTPVLMKTFLSENHLDVSMLKNVSSPQQSVNVRTI